MAKKESFSPIEDQFTPMSDYFDTSSTDSDMQEDSPDQTHVPAPGVHVTLNDSASNPLSTFPVSDDETTEELQVAEDIEQAQDPEMED